MSHGSWISGASSAGTPSPRGQPARHRGGPIRGHGDTGHSGRRRLSDSPCPRATLEISQRTVKSRRPVRRARASPAGRRRGRGARSATGRDAALWRDENDTGHPAPDRAAGELHQHPARAESGPIKRGRPLDQQIAAPTLPPGLPLDLLLRRPDIRRAEQQLVSANARMGVAKALLFPQVTIRDSPALAARRWRLLLRTLRGIQRLTGDHLPIFNMGRLEAGVAFNEASPSERDCGTSKPSNRRCVRCRTPS